MSTNGLNLHDSAWMRTIENEWEKYQETLWSLAEDVYEGDEAPDTLSGEPYCGCSTCETREAIVFFAPYIIRGFKEGKIDLED